MAPCGGGGGVTERRGRVEGMAEGGGQEKDGRMGEFGSWLGVLLAKNIFF